jgi:hypothetical protein
MRPHVWSLLAVVLMGPSSPVSALERAVKRWTLEGEPWASATSAEIAYYNICTGWAWTWSGWGPQERIGVSFEMWNCGEFFSIGTTWHYVWTGSPSGYGYTGALALYPGDSDGCPSGSAFALQPYLFSSGWNSADWGHIRPPGGFATRVVAVYTTGTGLDDPLTLVTDRPAAGPTGPPACGTCYLSTRPVHSFQFGTAQSPLCPGSPLNDGTCNAELLWDLSGSFCTVSVESQSWAGIKGLYRR